MSAAHLHIVYEDNHLLAVNKPPGMPTMGVAEHEASLVRRAKQYIKRRFHKPGNVYLGIMSRLDAGTSGVVVFARTSKAAARLTEQFRNRKVQKTYWAIVEGRPGPASGDLTDWVRKDETRQRMMIVSSDAAGAQEARLRYRTLRAVGSGTLLEIELLTGRKHQIRLQLATRGWPVWGEAKYASAPQFPAGLALHARRLVIEHPVRREPLELVAPLPRAWRELGVCDDAS
jgi:23S rRNA pseudouridine1911/1915/1917 synthase